MRETVVKIGCEGGSITLIREKKSGEPWKFCMGTNEAAMYDMLSEEDLEGFGPSVRETEYPAGRFPALAPGTTMPRSIKSIFFKN